MEKIEKFQFNKFDENKNIRKSNNNLDILKDVSTHLTMRIGEQTLTIDEISKLTPGSLISLNKSAAELKIDILLDNNIKLGEGEIVVGKDDELFLKVIKLKK